MGDFDNTFSNTIPLFNNPPKLYETKTAPWVLAVNARNESKSEGIKQKELQIETGLGLIGNRMKEARKAGHTSCCFSYIPDFEYIPLPDLLKKCADFGYTTEFNGKTFTIRWDLN